MAVIGATQLEPVNVLGQYVQGLEAGRQFKAQRAKEAQVTQLQNMLMGATPKQLQDPEFINRLAVTPEGATIAKTLSESVAAQRTARKDELTIAREQGELVAREAGAFLTNPSLLNKATIDTWAQGAVQRGILSPEAYTRFQELSDDPAVLGPAMQRLQTQGMSLADQLKYQRPQGSTQDVGGVVVTIDPFTGKEIGRVDLSAKEIAARTAGRPQTTINMPAAKEFSKTLGETAAKRLDSFREKAESAVSSLQNSEQLSPLLDDPKFISGTFANARTAVAKAVGIDVSATESYFAGVGQQVAERITAFGAGTGLSDADRDFAKKIAAGEETLDVKSIRRIIRINNKTAQNVIDRYNTERGMLAKKEPEVLDYYPEVRFEGRAPANVSPTDIEALNWAISNPNDPRADAIKQRLRGR